MNEYGAFNIDFTLQGSSCLSSLRLVGGPIWISHEISYERMRLRNHTAMESHVNIRGRPSQSLRLTRELMPT